MKHGNGSVFTAVARFEPGPRVPRDDENADNASASFPGPSGSLSLSRPEPMETDSASGDFFSRPLSIQLKSGTALNASGATDIQSDVLIDSHRNDHEAERQPRQEAASMQSAGSSQAQQSTADGQEDEMPLPESSENMALVSSTQSDSQSMLSNVQSSASSKQSRRRRNDPHNKPPKFKKKPDPNSHSKFRELDFASRDFEFLKRDRDCASMICGSCSGKGHHLLDCVWPDARGDLTGCPFCNTKEHPMDNCPQQPAFDDFEWTHILVFRRANKPLLRTTRSWVHYAQLADRYATGAAVHDTMVIHEWRHLLSKGFPWTRSFGQNLARPQTLSRGPWVRYDYSNDSASQNYLKRDPKTMSPYIVFSDDSLKDERFTPR
ncbi:hypothetical protein HER10_EVM0008982 [Colletotrichum scovillei]|uniref:uncharacterized protein n=1 Tax=Colletotrichum scovillei TaxID=1209932 RepID=UPI0015C3F39A|nr:uncharacterized protein HER10_EVM0008982 [Colletotrichum scovillei]KAF4783343.1 hypothetical protein HER10_EVM0008982 [Colletotrichum scovillei]